MSSVGASLNRASTLKSSREIRVSDTRSSSPGLRLTLTRPQSLRRRRNLHRHPIQAKASGDGGDFDLNPFKNKKSEDSARRALQGIFKDKDDVLSEYDGPPGGRGGRGGGGGGGGWRNWFSGWFGDFDPRGFGSSFTRFLRGFMSTLAAIALFGLVMYALSYWQQVVALVTLVFVKLFRLDAGQQKITAAGSSELQADLTDNKKELGSMEESVMAKYGGEDYFADGDDEAEGDEEDEL